MLDKVSMLFNKIFTNSERIEYTDHITKLINADTQLELNTNEVVSFYDFKNRRVIIYGTNFGNLAIVEDRNIDNYDYFILYDSNSPIKHLLPFRNIEDRDILYIFGDVENNIRGISERIDYLIGNLQEFFTD